MDWRGDDMRHRSTGRGMLRLTLVLLIAGAAWSEPLPDSLCVVGGSMEPTLANESCWAIRDTTGGVERGDIVWLPHFHNYVKRITAVEGDTVEIHNTDADTVLHFIIPPKRLWIASDGHGVGSHNFGTVPRSAVRAIVVTTEVSP